MSTTATRTTLITFTGDVTGTETISAASNASSPGTLEIKTLSSGANTITLPTGGSTVVSCTIVPPPGNTVSLTIKGISGDTGFRLHNTDPTTLTFHSTVSTFVITTDNTCTGVRFYWT